MPDQQLGTVEIPARSIYSYPLSLTIHLYQEGGRFGMQIHPEKRQPQKFSIDINQHDLASLSTQLKDGLAVAVATHSQTTTHHTPEYLENFADLGYWAFRRIFGDPAQQSHIQSLLNAHSNVSIEIVSDRDLAFPWELLYPLPPGTSPVSFENFWGMKYSISRILVEENRLGAWVPPEIHVQQRPRIGLLVNHSLSYVTHQEIPFFEGMEKAQQIALYKLRNLDPSRRSKEIHEFKQFASTGFHIAHWACHAQYKNSTPNLSYWSVSDDFEIRYQDIENHDVDFTGNPLVIMNACEGGNLNLLYTSYFAEQLLKHGARGVVATECEVPDKFAAEFAIELYQRLLTGEEIGTALLAVRQHFLHSYGNSTGLLYSLYGPPAIRLVQSP